MFQTVPGAPQGPGRLEVLGRWVRAPGTGSGGRADSPEAGLQFGVGPTHTVAGLQRRPLIIEPGGLEGEGFESGLLKMGIEGAL